jgi:predicted kinase
MSVTSARSREQAIARILELAGRAEPTTRKAWLVLTVGLPGSGKSTFCRKLAAATGAVILESDALRAALFATPSHDTEESRQLFEALYGAAGILLHEGVSVIVDATSLRERDRQPAYDTAAEAGAGLLILHFRVPFSVSVERLALRDGRKDPEDRSRAGMAVYTRLAETEQPVLREHWKIDTSDEPGTRAALQRLIETIKPGRPVLRQSTGGTSI